MLRLVVISTMLFSFLFFQAAAPEWMNNASYGQDSEDDDVDEQDRDDLSEGLTTLPIIALNFSVIRKGRVMGTVSIVAVLVIVNPTDDEIGELRELQPLMRSDLMSVANLLSQKRFRVNRPIDPNFVALHFQRRIDQRIGKDRIKIYIQDAIIRPRR